MRPLFAIALLTLWFTPALAEDCTKIAAPQHRLRCYDAQAKANSSPPPPRFDKYPQAQFFGRKTMPDFAGRAKDLKEYRTRIRAAVQEGPNFGGNMSLLPIGCGTGCTFVLAIDLNTGTVHNFPIGGDDYPSLDLDFERTSRLIVAHYWSSEVDNDKTRCLRTSLVWDGQAFTKVEDAIDIGPRIACNQVLEKLER